MREFSKDQTTVLHLKYYRKNDPNPCENDFRERWMLYLQLVPAVTLAIDMALNKLKFKRKFMRSSFFFMTLFIIHASLYHEGEGPVYPENLSFFNTTINYSKLHRNVYSPSDEEVHYGDIYRKEVNLQSCIELGYQPE